MRKKQTDFPHFRLKVLLAIVFVLTGFGIIEFIASTAANVLIYGVYDFSPVLQMFVVSVISGFSLPLVFYSIVTFVWLNPLHRCLWKLFHNEEVGAADLTKAKKIFISIPRVLLALNILAYYVGFVIWMGLSQAMSVMSLRYVLVAFVFINASLLVVTYVQISFINLILDKPRRLLKIQSMDEVRKEMSLQAKTVLVNLAILFYVAVLFIQISFDLSAAETSYANLMEQVYRQELSLDAARSEYKGLAADASGFSAENIPFPYDLDQAQRRDVTFIFAVLLVGVLLLFGFVLSVNSKAQVKQLRSVKVKVAELAAGASDLTKRIEITQFDEVGEISSELNRFLEKLSQIFAEICKNSEAVYTTSKKLDSILQENSIDTEALLVSSNQISESVGEQASVFLESEKSLKEVITAMETIAENVDTQASFVEQTSSAITEMVASIQSVTDATDKANHLSDDLKRVAEEGRQAVKDSIVAVRDVEASSEEVGSTISLISRVAAQTNLLAMNASIEAAHAGAAGTGFAVVADEVRSLAENSASSAKKISEFIAQMLSYIDNGVNLSENAGLALERVSGDIKKTTQLVTEIASAMKEQNAGASEILDSIHSLVDSTNSIKDISREQKEKNRVMRKTVEDMIRVFGEINDATNLQVEKNLQIKNGLQQMNNVSEENKQIVQTLLSLMHGFKIEE